MTLIQFLTASGVFVWGWLAWRAFHDLRERSRRLRWALWGHKRRQARTVRWFG